MWVQLLILTEEERTGLEVMKLEFILKLKIKRNVWLLADMCQQATKLLRFILSLRLYSSCITSRPGCFTLTVYLIETPFNTFANGADPDQATRVRAVFFYVWMTLKF